MFPPPGRIREAAALLARAGRTEGAGDVAALGDLLAATAAVSPATVRAHVQAAATRFEQASRAPGARTLDGTARTRFKAAARALERAPRTARGGGAPAVLNLLLALVEAIEAATAWHRAQHHRAQTTAAAQAAALLREAADLLGTTSPLVLLYAGIDGWRRQMVLEGHGLLSRALDLVAAGGPGPGGRGTLRRAPPTHTEG
ncbi:hypothetical protein ACFV0W_00285, partial [Streptomyces anulatus]